MPITAVSILKQYWGFDSFRDQQEEIIQSILEGKDTIALFPTGGGKSICYQVPAMMKKGLCLVISPLIALMKDQLEALIDKGIDAAMLNNSMNFNAVNQTLLDASNGNYKFLFVSPERLRSRLFKDYLSQLDINLIAVDEAHCISQWGYDFRPAYIEIAEIREVLTDVPILALTASATKFVQDDIIDKLKLNKPILFQQSFIRPRLSYSVIETPDKINKLLDILQKVSGTSIVYCRSRLETKSIAQLLQQQNIAADYYHAGLGYEERSSKQKRWMANEIRVMVCTNAFGMGIDKPDVRTVIHLYVPDCIESYYQEAGRAGRDNKPAYAVMIYNDRDIYQLSQLSERRFPPVALIKDVYQALANYMQIPVASGEGQSFDINMDYFIEHFKLDINLVTNVIKLLEQEGHIVATEGALMPSSIQFVSDKEAIESISNGYPELDQVIKALMRSYSGIFDSSVYINEYKLAAYCKLTVEVLIKQLNALSDFGIIEYLPKKSCPQILFLQNRAPASQLYIDIEAYSERKKRFEHRVAKMRDYLSNKTICRSEYIAGYFDVSSMKCGICDVCLFQKKKAITIDDFESIKKHLLSQISIEGIETEYVLSANHYNKDKFWKVVHYLEEQEIITIKDGRIMKI